jgi:predicted hydrocarbon binding protein
MTREPAAGVDRQTFLKTCLVGLSSCVCAGVGSPSVAAASSPRGLAAASSARGLAAVNDETVDAVRVRYAKLVELIGRHVPEETQRTLFRELGRECARQFKAMTWEKFPGDLEGFLSAARGPNGWIAGVEHDREAGTLTIADRPSSCSCPLVKPGLTPPAQCECTLGWQEETYSKVLGRPVKASLVESLLRGGKRCAFRIDLR